MARRTQAPVTLERLKEVLDYNPQTGDFTWRTQNGAARAGEIAGAIGPIGYRYLTVDYESFPAQQAAWLYHYGEWPTKRVMRRNEDRLDNSIDNLYLQEIVTPLVEYEDVAAVLSYDGEAGTFIWKKPFSNRVKAGDAAGRWICPRKGSSLYLFIGLAGKMLPATQVAWLLTNKEWPDRSVQFVDGDSTNLRIANLRLAKFAPLQALKDGRRVYRNTPEASRYYALRRYYDLTPEQYDDMFLAQDGKCFICNAEGSVKKNADVSALHVDHCHKTNQVRALLCGSCNGMLGLAKDSPETLRAAADYIEYHAARIESLQSFDPSLEEMN